MIIVDDNYDSIIIIDLHIHVISIVFLDFPSSLKIVLEPLNLPLEVLPEASRASVHQRHVRGVPFGVREGHLWRYRKSPINPWSCEWENHENHQQGIHENIIYIYIYTK